MIELINSLFEGLLDEDCFNLCILFTAKTEREAHVLEELKQAKSSKIYDDSFLIALFKETKGIEIVTSKFAGLGKSELIKRKCAHQLKRLARCPCYGEMSKGDIVELLN